MTQCLSVREALEIANTTGQQVNITLKSGTELEGVIVERLWRSSFRVWLEPAERVEKGQDVDKAIVATHAVASVNFNLDDSENENTGSETNVDKCRLEGIREALEIAMLTRQSVNVNLNREDESVRLEGFIENVTKKTFCILLDEDTLKKSEKRQTVKIAEVEYVEYS